MAAGRPKKYTKKSLKEAIDGYFESISYTSHVRDALGRTICNDSGEPIKMIVYAVAPSITGLCLHLGIDRSTWQNYCDKKIHPEFHKITSEARAKIEAWLEQELNTREKNVQGIIFNLQNNYGWKDKKEIGLDESTRESVAAAKISLADKIAAIKAAQIDAPDTPKYSEEDEG